MAALNPNEPSFSTTVFPAVLPSHLHPLPTPLHLPDCFPSRECRTRGVKRGFAPFLREKIAMIPRALRALSLFLVRGNCTIRLYCVKRDFLTSILLPLRPRLEKKRFYAAA